MILPEHGPASRTIALKRLGARRGGLMTCRECRTDIAAKGRHESDELQHFALAWLFGSHRTL